jgi:putative ABC transport system substrate-binding protein
MYFDVQFALEGGLMAYSANVIDQHRRSGVIVAKILSGRQPADLPVELPTKFDFAVNTSTLHSLGLELSSEAVAQVTESIE